MPYGLKIELSSDEVDKVRDYTESIVGKELLMEKEIRAEVMKADIKERKGKATLLLRYRYIEGM